LNDLVKLDREFEIAKVLELQGDIYLKLDETKNIELALLHYKRSISIKPNNLVLLLKMGKCYDKRHKFLEAIEQYTKALLMDPENSSIMFKVGWAYLRSG
jgi:tetratricopeptide (TPR) repeat protein